MFKLWFSNLILPILLIHDVGIQKAAIPIQKGAIRIQGYELELKFQLKLQLKFYSLAFSPLAYRVSMRYIQASSSLNLLLLLGSLSTPII